MTRRPVAVLGATGVAGRQALVALSRHPWFEIAVVAASARRDGRRLGDVLEQSEGLPGDLLDLELRDGHRFDPREVALVFSMLPSSVAAELETRCARTTPVVSTASAYRMQPDTPLLLAGVNPGHARLLEVQRRARGWQGFVAPTPNCTTVGLAVTLAPLMDLLPRAVSLTSLQAVSGAGALAPAVAAAVQDNLLPWIDEEEHKVESETVKILGDLQGDALRPASFPVSATCTRVAVTHGHTLSVSVGFDRPVTPETVRGRLRAHDPWAGRNLPGVPARWVEVRDEPDRPQPRLDRDAGGGMTTVVGRLRPDPATGGVKYVVVSHNAVLGAAGGAVLLAEDLVDRGVLA